MKVELLCGGTIENDLEQLDIEYNVTYIGETFKVIEVEKQDFKKMNEDFSHAYSGWWRYAKGCNLGTPFDIFTVNGQMLIGWASNPQNSSDYDTLTDYLCEELGVSTETNVCACVTDLAKANGMSISKLFKVYQG